MPDALPGWLKIRRGTAPLILSLPHTGTDIPEAIEQRLVSLWLGRKDADWWVDRLYAFAEALDATIIRTAISRSVIDVNRDPSGASLYPGQTTTGLCPAATFDGEPLYREGEAPEAAEIEARRGQYFDPYHAALAGEIARLRGLHERIVLYDAHSIRSQVPRLFEGTLPQFNIGTNDRKSCDPGLTAAVERVCAVAQFSQVTDGRFKGGYITRYHGQPDGGVHAIQMELACRGYMDEPTELRADNWPPDYDAARAEPLRAILEEVLNTCLTFALTGAIP